MPTCSSPPPAARQWWSKPNMNRPPKLTRTPGKGWGCASLVSRAPSVEAAIALRYPESIEEAYEVREAVAEARLAYYVLHQNEGNAPTRFPESGWLEGAVNDLADLVRLVSVPQREVEVAADRLQAGIEAAADILDQLEKLAPAVPREMAQLLGMSDVLQTRRMACAIIANAMVFQERIAVIHDGVKPLQLVCGPDVGNLQAATLEAWTAILEINYWPIFAIARNLLGQLPSEYAAQILAVLKDTAQGVSAAGVTSAHDLTGRIFQRLIADRKYLATFYTLPASAALLARLAVAKLKDVDWGPILTPSESCASGTSPAAPGHCCRRCTTRSPPRRDRECHPRPQVRRRAEPSTFGALRRQRRLARDTGDGA